MTSVVAKHEEKQDVPARERSSRTFRRGSDMGKPELAKLTAVEVRRLHELEIPGSQEPLLWQDIYKFIDKASSVTLEDSEKQKIYETIAFDSLRVEVYLQVGNGTRDRPCNLRCIYTRNSSVRVTENLNLMSSTLAPDTVLAMAAHGRFRLRWN